VKGYVIHLFGAADGQPTQHDNSYVVDYQPEFWAGSHAHDQHFLRTSPQIAEARVFPSTVEAFAYWRQTPPAPHDVRADGKPNRPLTAFHVTMVPVEVSDV
jgi:hypothetical protein